MTMGSRRFMIQWARWGHDGVVSIHDTESPRTKSVSCIDATPDAPDAGRGVSTRPRTRGRARPRTREAEVAALPHIDDGVASNDGVASIHERWGRTMGSRRYMIQN